MGLTVALLGTLYGRLFKVGVQDYVPYLTLGFVVWGLVNGLITDGSGAFLKGRNIIQQVRLPLSVHVYRVVWSNLVMFLHNVSIFVVVAVVFSVWAGWAGLLALVGLAVVCLNGVWGGLLLGMFSARYRDVPPIIDSVVRIVFFVTPIIWMPDLLPGRAVLLDFNPFYHVLEVVRAPLLGEVPALKSWLAVAGITAAGWLVTLALFARYRARVAYWV